MRKTSYEFRGSKIAKAIVLLVAFLFVITPLFPALAAEDSSNVPSQDQSQIQPTEPAEEITPTEPVDSSLEQDPVSVDAELPATDGALGEEKDSKLKDVAPTAQSLSINSPSGALQGISDSAKTHLSPEIDSSTGSLVYRYAITVPPGRNEMTPDISLVYNSAVANIDSIIGSGWDINIPSIQRINKDGSNNMYSESYFASSIDGELISLGSGNYAAKDENANFNKYSLASNVWTVTDKKGTVYKFGTNAAERQDNSADTSKVYKWMLQETRDTNDNYIKYEYYKDAGQIYPSKITYTGNGTSDGVLEVNFDRTSRTGAPTYFNTGFSVKSNYRITEIRTEVSDVWARKYTLAYTTGDNASGSYLNTIVESGQDDASNVTTLPAVDFNYNTSTPGWTYSSSWPLPLSGSFFQIDYGFRMGDINGDGLPDIVCHNQQTGAGTLPCQRDDPRIFINNGAGWTDVSTTWLFPVKHDDATKKEAFLDQNNPGKDTGLRLVDVNGDNLADLVRDTYVYLNNGSGWTYSSSWVLPLNGSNFNIDYGFRMEDINGDGLPDVVCHNQQTGAGSLPCQKTDPRVFLNNGSGWTDVSTTWLFPTKQGDATKREAFLDQNNPGKDAGLRLVDINGDGLNDLIRGTYAYLNNGSGWIYDSTWAVPPASYGSFYQPDYAFRMSDMNGDGFPDILCHSQQTGAGSLPCQKDAPKTYLNSGTSWTDVSTTWLFPTKQGDATKKEAFLDQNNPGKDEGLRVLDINGDGMADLVRATYAYLSNENMQANLLTEIIYPQGGSTTVTYKGTPQFRNGSTILNPNMPMVLDVVSQIANSDGLGLTETYDYSYEGGKYYFNTYLDRKFSGFNKVTRTDSAGNKIINFYHQGNTTDTSNGEYSDHISKIGKVYKTEVRDSSNNLFALTINKWDKYDLGSGRNFVKNVRSTELTYDGDSDHKDKAEEYTYDNTYGNLTQKVEWGEVNASADGSFTDTGSDKFTTDYSYAANTTPYIVGLLSQDTKTDQSSIKVKENKYYYDGQTLGSVTDGNLTKQEMWKIGSTYVDIEKTYNTTYGIVTQTKDPRDKTTAYSYDSYNLYPATITNALSQATSYTYDYSSGQVKQITDPNTRVYQTTYDGLDRVTAQKQPDLASPSTLVNKTTLTYTDASGAVKIQKTDYLDGSTSVDTYTYFDGLNRLTQARQEMEDGSYAVTDTVYNNIGQVYKQSLPYSSSGSAKTSATTTAALLSTNSYDSMLRVTSTVNAVGTTSNAYDDWKLTTTDPKSKTKDLTKDAYGNLVKVEEHNGVSTYTTNYEYNGNNNLTKITDALSNVRSFTYDGLGGRLTAEDLHASADATYGSYTYTYDDSGNLTSVVDPKSQTINYTYDDLNRLATEDYAGQAGTEVTYTYDSGTDGIGKLTSVAAIGANSSYAYDANGNRKQEAKTINSTGYQTDYTYDRQGNQIEITNPDSSKVKYTYNTAGQLETIQRKESTDGAFINVGTDFDYGPQGKVTYQAFQNGSATTNTYDSTKLYRLSNKTTTITGGSKMQDLTYTYDNNGNVTKIVDASNTNSSKTADYTYDDLNRLLSATITAVASGQSTYTHNYTYDAIGNILTRTDAAGTYSYAGNTGSNYANPHAVTSVGSVNYTYDNNGNMLTETSGLSNTWDYNNRLTQAVKGGVTSTYSYDQDGQRVKLSNGTTTTYYPSQFYNTDGTNIIKHITTPDGDTVATVKGTGGSAAVYSVHTDHLTGSNVITNSSGTQEELLDYFPYGNVRIDQKAGSFGEQRQFTGHEYDTDTGLNYMDARYYNPAIGRFMSQDSAFINLTHLQVQLADPQSWNSYSYARNNPLAFIDPDGNMWTPWQSSGSFGAWMGNGGFLHNIYRSNVNSLTNTIQSIQQTGWTKTNVMDLGADAASITAKTSGVVVGSVGIGMGAGAVANVLSPAAATTGTTACAGGGCDKAQRAATTIYNDAVSRTLAKFPNANLPSRADVIKNFDQWENTTFSTKTDSMLYHAAKHGDLNTLTNTGHNVWNSYVSNQSGLVRNVTNLRLGNGDMGLRIRLMDGSGGIFTNSGKIISSWKK